MKVTFISLSNNTLNCALYLLLLLSILFSIFITLIKVGIQIEFDYTITIGNANIKKYNKKEMYVLKNGYRSKH